MLKAHKKWRTTTQLQNKTKKKEKRRRKWPNSSLNFVMHFFCITTAPPRGYKICRLFSLINKDYNRVEDTCLIEINVGKEDLKHHTRLTDISSQSDLWGQKDKIILIATQPSPICLSHSGPVKARLRCVNRLRVQSFFLTL